MNKLEIKPTLQIIRKPELTSMLGLSDPTIWRMEKKGDFPGRIKLGGNSVGWLLCEVEEWIKKRAAGRMKNRTDASFRPDSFYQQIID